MRLLEQLLPALAARLGRAAGAGRLPAARRGAAGPAGDDPDHPGRRALPRSVVPARQRRACCAGCGASATASASSNCSPKGARLRARARRPQQCHRRLPGRDARRCQRSSTRLPRGGPARCGRRLRLQRRGRHGGGRRCPARWAPRRSTGGCRKLVDLAEQLTSARAEERIGSVVEVLVEEVDRGSGLAGAGLPTRRRRSTAPAPCAGPTGVAALPRSAIWCAPRSWRATVSTW